MYNQLVDTASFDILKENIISGILKVHPECGGYDKEVVISTVLGEMFFRTHDASPHAVSTIYLNGIRVYKILIGTDQSREASEMTKMLETKLARDSFSAQAEKVLNINVGKS